MISAFFTWPVSWPFAFALDPQHRSPGTGIVHDDTWEHNEKLRLGQMLLTASFSYFNTQVALSLCTDQLLPSPLPSTYCSDAVLCYLRREVIWLSGPSRLSKEEFNFNHRSSQNQNVCKISCQRSISHMNRILIWLNSIDCMIITLFCQINCKLTACILHVSDKLKAIFMHKYR